MIRSKISRFPEQQLCRPSLLDIVKERFRMVYVKAKDIIRWNTVPELV
jgi:hypothetical protein